MQPQSDQLSEHAIRWRVLKFGGTSVSTAVTLQHIRTIVLKHREQPQVRVMVVVSALAGVTTQLHALSKEFDAASLDALLEQHQRLARDVGLPDDWQQESGFAQHWQRLSELLQQNVAHDSEQQRFKRRAQIAAHGELMSSCLVGAYLSQFTELQWQDVRQLLTADLTTAVPGYREWLSVDCQHQPDPAMASRLSARACVHLTQGYLCADEEGNTRLLGRGGADTSAAYLGARLQAELVEIWTDVPGLFSANPKLLPEARLLRQVTYHEAREIATTGAKVLHPRCLRPLQQAGIPLRVASTFQPQQPGTLIGSWPDRTPQIKAINVRRPVTMVSLETLGMWQEIGFLAQVFAVCRDAGVSVDLVSTAESCVSFTVDTKQEMIDYEELDLLEEKLRPFGRVTVNTECAAITLVGNQIKAMLPQLAPVFRLLEHYPLHLITQAANDLNFTFVVEATLAEKLLKELHSLLIVASDSEEFGAHWQQLTSAEIRETVRTELWWEAQRQTLIELGKTSAPLYVYNGAVVESACRTLTQMENVSRVFYALKANAHAGLLRVMEQSGIGFECVSIGELEHIKALFPALDPKRVLFTPNFAERFEYQAAFEIGCFVTIDNLYLLQRWPEIFAGRQVLLRIDPGRGYGHHQYVKTAGAESKFGIPLSEVSQALELANKHNIEVIGLHSHTGSGILRPENWLHTAQVLSELLPHCPQVKYLDLGGGLGVPMKPDEPQLPIQELDHQLGAFKAKFPHLELWLEPGRFLVAEAGVLLARVTQLKGKAGQRYVGVNTGMNSLLRPALYGSYHPIVNLNRHGEAGLERMTVVGPLCESGDRLGSERLLPECQEGDILLVGHCGAYGAVMSSHYNLRAPAKELLLD